MVLEYLFWDKDLRQKVELFNQSLTQTEDGASKEPSLQITYKELKNSDSWIVRYEQKGQTEKTAKQLSEIGYRIVDQFSPIVFTDECSVYFNKRIFPLVNRFERLLRQFLYLKVSNCKDKKLIDLISSIEDKDFGAIYSMLFVDSSFQTVAKKKINNLNTRTEMIQALEALQENTAWDILVGGSDLSTIKENFNTLKDYRNDAMHAHNISYDRFIKTRKLFEEVNTELEQQIDLVLQSPAVPVISEKTASSLFDRLAAINRDAENFTNGISVFIDLLSKLASPEPIGLSPGLSHLIELIGSLAIEKQDSTTGDKPDSSINEAHDDE